MSAPVYTLSRWIKGGGPRENVVLSSRVRLARNIAGHPYPCLAPEEDSTAVARSLQKLTGAEGPLSSFHYLAMGTLSPATRQALVDRHLVSPQLAREKQGGGVLINADESVSIMVNEEDHLRMQVLLPGLQLEEAWREAVTCDEGLEEIFTWAFDDRFGYLTACPTNLGTGLRASVMLHLPALIGSGRVKSFLGALTQVGLTVRGLYGEGSRAAGNLVQVSNQVTLGQGEDEIIGNLAGVVERIVAQEEEARQTLLDKNRPTLLDGAWRALGLLKHARLMTMREALALISDLRLGLDLGLIEGAAAPLLNELLVLIRPGCLQLLAGRQLSRSERDIERAAQLRKTLEARPLSY